MNSFGLGLVLNFTDNATAGLSRVSQTFNQMNGLASQLVDSSDSAAVAIMSLSVAGQSLSMVGDQLSDVGSSIVGLFTTMTQSVLDTGGKMLGFRSQLRALYGEDSYEQKLQQIKDYAQSSVFEVEGLVSAITVMKAVGIEAMDEVTSSSGQTTQRLLDYASDIAAMFPNMRNAYGTGVEAAMGALKEYIAEGNAMSLKRGAGLDILGLLGEEKGKNIEERTRQVADLVEMMGVAGYTASLAGTPTQQLAKIQDTLFNVMSDIADSGVYDQYTRLLTKAATWIETLTNDTEKYNAVVSIVGDTLTTILTPLEKLLDFAIGLADKFINWAVEHQTLAKYILITVGALGVFLLLGGKILKFAGSIFMLASAFMQMSVLAKGGVSIFTVFGTAIKTLLTKFLLPFIAIAGVLYTVWKSNLFGIRDIVTSTFGFIWDTIKLVFDAFSDNTLSFENFEKAKEMGILPFIEAILDFKYQFGLFIQSIKDGYNALLEFLGGLELDTEAIFQNILGFYTTYLAPFVDKIVKAIDRVIAIARNLWESWLRPIFMQIGDFLSNLWTRNLSPLLQKLGSFAMSVVNFVWTIINVILWLWNNVLGPVINWLVTVLAPAVNGVVQTIIGIVTVVFNFISDIVGGILTTLGGLLDFISGVFSGDWELAWQGICDIFGGIWDALVGIVKGVVNSVILVINTLISSVYACLAGVVNGIGDLAEGFAEFLGYDIDIGIPETAPQIPYLEKGGKVTEPVTAVIGEGKDDEVVLPLNNQVFSEIAKGINNNRPVTQSPVQNDYSVTFAAGSVVIQLANATEAELEKAAEKLMRIIERKQQLKAMAVRA